MHTDLLKQLSVITSEETSPAENGLSEMWMNPEEYIDIPVVSLDESSEDDFVPEEAFFKPEPVDEKEDAPEAFSADSAKDDIFGLINSMKNETDGETGFSNILAEIESNTEILPLANDYAAIDDFLKTLPVTESEETEPVAEDTPEAEQAEAPETESDAIPEVSEETEAINTDSEEFERTLAALLNDEPSAPEQENETADSGFVVDIPDDGNDYSFAANQSYEEAPIPPAPFFGAAESYEQQLNEQPERVVIGDFEAAQKAALEADITETKQERKERKKREKEEKKNGEKKPVSKGEIVRRVVLALSFVVMFVCAAGCVIAGFAAKVGELANEGCEISESIIADEAKAYAKTVIALIDELESCPLVSLYGGVFQHNAFFRDEFMKKIRVSYPQQESEILDITPEEGAIKAARLLLCRNIQNT